MTKKFDAKKYQNKNRVYPKVPGSTGIHRLLVWDSNRMEYIPPPRGGAFEAFRWVIANGKRKRIKATFSTISEARQWQAQRTAAIEEKLVKEPEVESARSAGPLFGEIVEEWCKREVSNLEETTQVSYLSKIRNYLTPLFDVPIHDLTPQRIDQWIDWLKNPRGKGMTSKRRYGFKHELDVISAALRYYGEYYDDSEFRFPIKARHRQAIRLNREKPAKLKDFTEAEFLRFRSELEKTRYGTVLALLATVHYYQALRVSEAAALHWEDVRFDETDASQSRLLIQRRVVYTRKKGEKPYCKRGFKNSKSYGDVKEQPLFPESHAALYSVYVVGTKGLISHIDGEPISYRTIQHYYDLAFKAAGLPYSATHVLRHGRTMAIYNETPDLDVAKQLLGDRSDTAAKTYAKRRASALTDVVQKHWRR